MRDHDLRLLNSILTSENKLQYQYYVCIVLAVMIGQFW